MEPIEGLETPLSKVYTELALKTQKQKKAQWSKTRLGALAPPEEKRYWTDFYGNKKEWKREL